MSTNFTDEFFRDSYDSEVECKYKPDSADSLLVGILFGLSGVGIYYLKILPTCNLGAMDRLFIVFGALFAAAFLSAGYYVAASLHGWGYFEYIASPRDWGQYVDGLKTYYARYHNEQVADQKVANDLARQLRQRHIDAAGWNQKQNERKMGCQARARGSIIAAAALILLNAPATYFRSAIQDGNASHGGDFLPRYSEGSNRIPQDERNNAMSENKKTNRVPTSQQRPTPAKPGVPKNVLVRNNDTKARRIEKR